LEILHQSELQALDLLDFPDDHWHFGETGESCRLPPAFAGDECARRWSGPCRLSRDDQWLEHTMLCDAPCELVEALLLKAFARLIGIGGYEIDVDL